MTDTSRRLIEVRPSRGERWTALLFACALLALLVATVYFSRAARLDDPLVLAAVAGAVALLAFIWAYQGAERVRLTDQTIERIDMFSREVRRLDRISTIRVVEDLDGGRELQLTGSGHQAPMVLPTYALQDPRLRAWVDTLSDPGRDAFERARARIEADERLGPDVETRRRRLKRLRIVARSLGILGFAAGVWGWMYPDPYALLMAILIAVPLLAVGLAVASGGLYALMPGRAADLRPSLAAALIMPCLVLAGRAALDGAGSWVAAPPALAIAVGLIAIAVIVQPRPYRSWAAAARAAAVLFVGAWGAVGIIGLLGVWP